MSFAKKLLPKTKQNGHLSTLNKLPNFVIVSIHVFEGGVKPSVGKLFVYQYRLCTHLLYELLKATEINKQTQAFSVLVPIGQVPLCKAH